MKKVSFLVLIAVLIVAFGFASMVYAQGRQNAASESNMVRPVSNQNGDDTLGLICSDDIIHPLLMNLEDSFNVEYKDLLIYFCEHKFGVGEIMLALITAEREGIDLTYDDILQMRFEDDMKEVGWGQIWQDLGLIGRERHDHEEEMGQEGRNNKPEYPPGLGGPPPGKGPGSNH